MTHVEFAGPERGQFFMARGARQGCPASGFLFAMVFDPIFRWLQESIILKKPDNLEFLQPAQCAYADDPAVGSSSLRGLMIALALAFRSVDSIAGLNLNYRKFRWVQYGTVWRDSLQVPWDANCSTRQICWNHACSSVLKQARITLSHLHFLGLAPFVAWALIWWAFIPSASRHVVELQYAPTRFSEVLKDQYSSRTQLHSSFRYLSPVMGKRIRCSIHGLLHCECIWYFLSVGPWWHTWRSPKGRKLQLACFWTNFINKTLLGLVLVVLRESWDRSVVIVLLTSNFIWKVSRVLLALGYLLASFASSVTCSVLHKDFTLKNMITSASPRYRNFWKILVIAWKEGFAWWRPSLLHTSTRIRQRVLLNIYLVSHIKTSGCPSPSPDIRIFPKYRWWHSLLMVKLSLDGVWFHDPLIEELMSCLVPSSTPRLIPLSLVLERTPTTLSQWLPRLKHCLFLVTMALWFGMSSRAFISILCMLLVFAWARSRLAHMCNCWHSRVKDPWFSLSTNFDSPCNMCMVTMVFGDECADHAVALGTWGFTSSHNVTTRWIHHNFDATACFDGCHGIDEIWERLQRIRTDRVLCCLFHIMGFSFVFAIGFTVLFCAFHVTYGRVCLLLSASSHWVLASLGSCFFEQVMDRLSSSASAVPSIDDNFEHNMKNPLLECFSSSNQIVFSPPSSWKSTWPWSDCLVILLFFDFVTKKACMILLDASSGTIVHGVSLNLSWFFCGWRIRYTILPSIYVLLLEPFILVRCCITLWLLVELNFSGTFVLSRAGGHQLVHGPGLKYSWKLNYHDGAQLLQQ